MTHAVPEKEGTRLSLGAQHLDAPQTLAELDTVLAGRDWKDAGEHGGAGIPVR